MSRTDTLLYSPVKAIVDSTVRYTYSYDSRGNLLEKVWEELHERTWKNRFRTTWTYDSTDKVIKVLSDNWKNGDWVTDSKSTYTYDSSENKCTMLNVKLDDMSGVWNNESRYTYIYDNDGNLLTYLAEFQWENGKWNDEIRGTYTYDINGHVLTELSEHKAVGIWVNTDKTTHTYDSNGKELLKLLEWWKNGAWVNLSRYTYNYDNSNELTILMEEWRNSSWVNNARIIHTYDSNGNMITMLVETWVNGAFVNTSKQVCVYKNNNAVRGENFAFISGVWHYHKSDLSLKYNGGADKLFFYAAKAEVEYSTLTSVENQTITASKFSLSQNYPNPFNPSTVIAYTLQKDMNISIKIYNTIGKEITTLFSGKQYAGSHNVTFNASNLPSGVYFCRIQSPDFSKCIKMSLIK